MDGRDAKKSSLRHPKVKLSVENVGGKTKKLVKEALRELDDVETFRGGIVLHDIVFTGKSFIFLTTNYVVHVRHKFYSGSTTRYARTEVRDVRHEKHFAEWVLDVTTADGTEYTYKSSKIAVKSFGAALQDPEVAHLEDAYKEVREAESTSFLPDSTEMPPVSAEEANRDQPRVRVTTQLEETSFGHADAAATGPAAPERPLLMQLRSMNNYGFEHLVADVWAADGWNTRVLEESGDRGIDVVAEKAQPFPQKHVIQAKRYQEGNNIGGPKIQQYASLQRQEQGVDSVIVVTTSTFTDAARERAQELNVKLVDGEQLVAMLDGLPLDPQELINRYTF